MNTARFVLCAFAALCGIITLSSKGVLANDLTTDNIDKTLPHLIINTNDWKPQEEKIVFIVTPTQKIEDEPLYSLHGNSSSSPYKGGKTQFSSSNAEKKVWEDEILAMLPQGDRLKKVWNLVDGDVDLYFEGLRFDRSNKGVTYKTKTLPLIGEIKDLEFRFDAGEDNEFSFKTKSLPFVGLIDGLDIKGAVGESSSKIFARYTIPLD